MTTTFVFGDGSIVLLPCNHNITFAVTLLQLSKSLPTRAGIIWEVLFAKPGWKNYNAVRAALLILGEKEEEKALAAKDNNDISLKWAPWVFFSGL